MRGLFFTAVTFLIFLAILTYVYVLVYDNIEKSKTVADTISAQRIYYTWHDVADSVNDLLNVHLSKKAEHLQINDSLPATENIEDLLDLYQEFVNQIYGDPTINIDFEDIDGNKINLSDMDPQSLFTIEPMNIVYFYPDYGKREMNINADPSNFSYIDGIEVFIKLKNVYFNCNLTHPSDPQYCEKWSPDASVSTCEGAAFNCLTLNLTFEDVNSDIFNFETHYFNVDSKSTANLDIKNVTGSYFITIQVGPLPTVLKVDLHNAMADSVIDMYLNTSDFYINLPSILNVTTPFGKKVDII